MRWPAANAKPDVSRGWVYADSRSSSQSSNTGKMIFKVPNLMAYLSQGITLEPGDIIATGTPEGVGIFRDPPVLLQPGDVYEVEIEGLGTLRNPMVS